MIMVYSIWKSEFQCAIGTIALAILTIIGKTADSRSRICLHAQEWSYNCLSQRPHQNILPGLLLSGSKSSFQMKVHFAFYSEIKASYRLEEEWRESKGVSNPVKLASVGCYVICLCWWWLAHCVLSSQPSTRALHVSIYRTLYVDADFLFSTRSLLLPKIPKLLPNGVLTMLSVSFIGQLAERDYMGYCQEEDEKDPTQKYRSAAIKGAVNHPKM